MTYAAALAGPVASSQTSGSLKPTAMDSDMSEPTVSFETANRRMSSDTSGSLNDTPDGATLNAQEVANSCLPAGEHPNKKPIFISGVRETRAFLALLRAICPGGLTAQLKSDKLMVVPSTAELFRAAVSALRSLDGREDVSFHTFTLPENSCVRLLVKNLQSRRPSVAERAPPQHTLPLRKNSGPVPLPSRWTWARGGITSFEGAYFQGHYPTNPYSKSPYQPVTEASEKPKVTATRKTAWPQKSDPKPQQPLSWLLGRLK